MAKAVYLTTTLPYVNADPHIGFALELVQADIIARYRRLLGDQVFFNTGTDEHGQKIWLKAEEKGEEVQAYVDHYAERFKSLAKTLNIGNDAFIRTTDEKHILAAQELWRRCAKDIEKRKFKGLYCVGCESFKKESDLVDGLCPDHQKAPEEVEEENYFFKFSNYQDSLLKYLERDRVVIPETKRQEAINFVKNGLEDFSISRLKSRMPWGIPVPGDDDQVMYVWFDALTNYISTLDWPFDSAQGKPGNFEKFWNNGEVIQFAGKDQVRFQSLMWQAMLSSAGVKNTDTVFYHGFINSGGQKMSKTIGNVVDPIALVEEYGVDAVRYYLARHINPFEDSDFTIEKFKDAYNAGLANGLGNLVSRVMKMATVNNIDLSESDFSAENIINSLGLKQPIEDFKFDLAMDSIWLLISQSDKIIQEKMPFQLLKQEETKAEGIQIIKTLGHNLAHVSVALRPFMPETAKVIEDLVKNNQMPDKPLFLRKD